MPRADYDLEPPAILDGFHQNQSERQKEEHGNSGPRNQASQSRRRQHGTTTGCYGYREWGRIAIRERHARRNLARCAEWRPAARERHCPPITTPATYLQQVLRSLTARTE